MERPMLTVNEAAERMGVSYRSVYRMIERRELPFFRIGKSSLRIHPDDVDAYMSKQRTEAIGQCEVPA